MRRPAPRGWCPSAERPMLSGDGLIVRLRPPLGRIEAGAFLALCTAAERYGNGILEVTSRASLQIRGVSEAGHAALLDEVAAQGLLGDTPQNGAGITVHPFWQPGDDTAALAEQIATAFAQLPTLPAKFGVVLDCGPAPILTDISADVRVERDIEGGLTIRADGAHTGRAGKPEPVAEMVAALARWFLGTGGAEQRRMRRHLAETPLPASFQGTSPAPARSTGIGPSPLGPVIGIPFGQSTAAEMRQLVETMAPAALRLTPWRAVLLEGAAATAPPPGFIAEPSDPLRRIEACPGAPACPAATVATRPIARHLSGRFPGRVHVSGCSKGCAWPRSAEHVLVGRNGAFDLVLSGTAWDTPTRQSLTPEEAVALAGAKLGDA
ncbi:MAG: cobalamin biosynthesis protein CobG [Pseudomonadota bacterium]